MYSSFTNMLLNYSHLDQEIKKRHPKIFSIIGGPGLTQRKDRELLVQNNSQINAICIGEGEKAITNFFSSDLSFKKNIIKPYQLDPIISEGYYEYVDIDTLDFPNREVVYRNNPLLEQMPSKQFMGSRGCPYRCTYCHNHTINEIFKDCGKTIRLKSVDYLIEEVLDVKKRYPLTSVVFQDDIFFFNKKWSYEFAEKWAQKVNLPWSCNIRADYITEDLIAAMKHSNCSAVSWSIESGNEFLRSIVLKRKMKDETIIQCAQWLNKYDILHRTGNIVGIPGETIEEMHETLKINIQCRPYIANAHIFIPFQGLELTKYALQNNHITEEQLVNIPETYFTESILNFTPEQKTDIRKMMLLFPILSAFPTLYLKRYIFDYLMDLNDSILSLANKIFVGYRTSKLFKVKTTPLQTIKMVYRYFIYGL